MFKKNKNNAQRPRKLETKLKKQQIYSYRSVRKETENPYDRSNSSESVRTQGSKFILRFSKILFVLIFILGIFYATTIEPNSKISIKDNYDASPRSKTSYEQGVNTIIDSSYLNKNKLTFDAKKIEDDIKQTFPEIGLAEVSVPFLGHQPRVMLAFSEPVAKLVTEGQTYILDGNGITLFSEKDAANSLNVSDLISVNDGSGDEITIGKPALSFDQLKYIQEIVAQAKRKNIKINTIALSAGGSGINVNYSDTDYIVKYSFYADARQSSGSFYAVYDFISGQPKEYIDVRIPDKVYVK